MTTDIFDFWSEIKPGQRIHPRDKAVLKQLEGTAHSLETRCLPAAFMGPLKSADVVLLYKGQGLSKEDVPDARKKKTQRWYRDQRQGDKPLPSEKEQPAAYRWWTSRTKVFSEDPNQLRCKVAILDIGAYHSEKAEASELVASLPSSRVTLDWAQEVLFPKARRGSCIVICMRAAKFWGLTSGGKWGRSLYAPLTSPSGHMCHGDMREEIIANVKKKLNLPT